MIVVPTQSAMDKSRNFPISLFQKYYGMSPNLKYLFYIFGKNNISLIVVPIRHYFWDCLHVMTLPMTTVRQLSP